MASHPTKSQKMVLCYTNFVTQKALTHFAIEFIPTLAFFIAAQYTDFYTATIILMVTAIISLGAGWWCVHRIPTLPILVTLFVTISGAFTLWYRAPDVLIISNSLYYLFFSTILLGGLLIKVNILKRIFDPTFAITDYAWTLLSIRWAVLFLFIGVGNEYVRMVHTPEVWVDYKFYTTILAVLFASYQFTLSRRYRLPEYSNSWGIRIKDHPDVRFSEHETKSL